MGRGRGKAKKLTGSGNEGPVPPYKRRGRPQKPLKDDIEEEEEEVVEIEKEGDDLKISTPTKETKGSPAAGDGKRSRGRPLAEENSGSTVDENGHGLSAVTTDESVKKNGFRQNGSRRKSKPRRAAEAGVDFI